MRFFVGIHGQCRILLHQLTACPHQSHGIRPLGNDQSVCHICIQHRLLKVFFKTKSLTIFQIDRSFQDTDHAGLCFIDHLPVLSAVYTDLIDLVFFRQFLPALQNATGHADMRQSCPVLIC